MSRRVLMMAPRPSSWAAISAICAISTPPIEPAICIICSCCAGSPIRLSSPTKAETPPTRTTVRRIHRKNCVSATQATPMIFPNISSVAFTEDTSTSTTLLAFSSMTLCITIPVNIAMNIYIMMERIIDMIIYTSEDVIFSSPDSPRV